MKKLFTLFFALVANVGIIYASYNQVDGIWYYFYKYDYTATVSYRGGSHDSYSNEYSGSVVIPSSVTYNGTTYSVTSIQDYAFSDCSSLSSVTIPNSVTSIGESAFDGCSSLTSVTINSDAIVNKSYTYSSLSSLSDIFGSQVTKYIIGDNVKGIGSSAFQGCKSLTSITIPNSVTSIGNQAFYSCSSLTSVTIPNSVTSIRSSTFSGCSSLTSVTIGDGVTSIGNYAFKGCSSLTSVTIPNSVTSIGEYAFQGCSSLTSVTIGNGVTSIGERAFEGCSSLTSVTIGNSVSSIGERAFSGCKSLTSITIPNSVTSIGESAFDGCSSLISVTINLDAIVNKAYTSSDNLSDIFGSQVTEYIIGDNVKGIGDYAFYGCRSLTSVTIGNSVTSIGDLAFRDCSSLTSVTIPNSVTSIGYDAFYGCKSLTSVTIGNGVTSIGIEAFENCTSLTSVNITDLAAWCKISFGYSANPLCYAHKLYLNGELVKDLVIPNSVTSIGWHAFEGCSSLTSITIPNSVTSIGWSAFEGCSSLTSVTIPNSVTSIGMWAFADCSSLTSVTIGNSVTSIDSNAFENCSSLTSVTIPNSVTWIGSSAFRDCSSLTSVTINSDAIVNEAYSSSYHLSDIFGSQVTKYIIGDNVKGIGNYAFWGCSSLTSITCKATTPPTVGSSAFYGVSKSIPVYVPCGCVEAYKAANGWKDFTNIQGPLAEYSITVGVNATKMGTAKVDINNACGAQISAKPNIGYHFVQWSDGVVNNPRSIVLTQDTVLIAEFAEIPSYVVEVIYNTDHGTVNGKGTYKEDEEVTLTATANDGYKFHKWSNGVTDNPYTFIIKSDVTLEAKFTSTEGVEEVLNSEVHTTKVIRDGQVLILRNGKTYTMQGQEVK